MRATQGTEKQQFQSTLPARGATARPTMTAARSRRFQSTLPARGATLTAGVRKIISIHAPRTGSDVFVFAPLNPFKYFNPRSPHGERLPPRKALRSFLYFNPRSPHGERLHNASKIRNLLEFQSTLPARGATDSGWDFTALDQEHFNPRSPHGERHQVVTRTKVAKISIHAPRTGSDLS